MVKDVQADQTAVEVFVSHFLCLTERRSTATQLHRYRGQPATAGASRT
uniref:Uncharacterized protein n=1 Tax=Escherichia coli TaxID=562 RepID=A0A2P1H2D7_ECOLX|nr:hypothetical protein pEC013_00014 [Escherichia coli]